MTAAAVVALYLDKAANNVAGLDCMAVPSLAFFYLCIISLNSSIMLLTDSSSLALTVKLDQ